ncbi:hypothetical protein SteCoe_27711 [Stentor coeruleus]|uniref:UTP23 sensor motif region domain-containing protein n=1 Tax=Stentor coeruleus TaxID=5963 RepID=A0A1R2B9Y3_9CILI|nr:hypothetical protein SteCoe_27711 [Stentor coeruleus]
MTNCIHKELEARSGTLVEGTLEKAKLYRKDPCCHAGETTAQDCILKFIGKKNLKKLFVATQDKELRKKARTIPCVPLVYFKHNIMTLDPPSEATLIKAKRKENMKFKPEASEKDNIKKQLQEIKEKEMEEKIVQRKYIYKDKERMKMKIELGVKRKAKGPNPLSCKKKSKIEQMDIQRGDEVKKIRRKRKAKSVEPRVENSLDKE